MHDILALATNLRDWDSNVSYAASLAARMASALTGMYIMPPNLPAYDFVPATLASEIVDLCREQAETALSAGKPFARWAAERGVKATSWHVSAGLVTDVMAGAATWHDLIVIERNAVVSWIDAGQLLLRIDIPCLIVAKGIVEAPIDTIAVAWDGSVPCVRAFRASLPLLKCAARIVVIDGSHSKPAVDGIETVSLDEYLFKHDLRATRIRIDPDTAHAGEKILAAATDASTDLLVMGAYGRTRFSEWAFGGATRHVLEHARVAVLMRH